LAGALGIAVEEAEPPQAPGLRRLFVILRPGIERIGSSILRQISGRPIGSLHLVGGA